jgi:hypothetical protein
MTYDRRYPWMTPVDGRPLPNVSHGDAMHIRWWAGQIAARTGLKPFYNSNFRNVLFALGNEPHGGPVAIDAVHRDGTFKTICVQDIDDACKLIGMGRLKRAEKAKIAAAAKQREQWEKNDKTDAFLAERRPDAEYYAGFLDRKRRGVDKVTA